jgi:tRNA (cmo5U34)-methyltransferase
VKKNKLRKVKNNFDRVAWCYDFLSLLVFGNRIKQSQIILFNHLKDNDKVLILGGGTGWMINEILKVKKIGRIDYIELSEEMLNKARVIVPVSKEIVINYIHGDEESITEFQSYDAVIACYFFDLFEYKRLEKVVAKVASSIKPKGQLLVADFNLSTSSPLLHKLLVKIMYLFFSITCRIEAKNLINPRRVFKKYGLLEKDSVSSTNGLIVSSVYEK